MQKISQYRVWGIVLLLFFAAQGIYSAKTLGQTMDETFFSAGGYAMVRYNNYEFLGEHPPLISQIGALPLLFLQPKFPIQNPLRVAGTDRNDLTQNGLLFLYRLGNDPNLILFLQRLPIIGLSVLLGLMLFLFAGELFGVWGALLSLCLFCFCPNMIAHGSLYTTDMGLTAIYFFSIFALKRFFDQPNVLRAVTTGILCGMTFMSKISGLILFPVVTVLFILFRQTQPHAKTIKILPEAFDRLLGIFSLFLLINAIGQKQAMVTLGPLCLLTAYLCCKNWNLLCRFRAGKLIFRGLLLAGCVLCLVFSLILKKKYGIGASAVFLAWNIFIMLFSVLFIKFWNRDSDNSLLKFFLAIWLFAGLFIILDYTDFFYKWYRFIGFGNFVKPLGIVFFHSGGGHRVCVEGSFVTCDWRYFFGVMAVKTPLLTLGLAILGFFMFLCSRRSFFTKTLVILPLVFFWGAAILNGINIGLRHILPIFPFLFLLAGVPGAMLARMQKGGVKTLLTALLIIALIAFAGRTLRTGPDYLVYFNELIGGADQGAKLVADSNLNWGQDNAHLAEFVRDKKIPFVKIASEAMNGDVYDYYKIRWKSIDPSDWVDPKPGFYALGVGVYTDQQKNARSWFREKVPFARIGKTIYVFKVAGK